MYIGTLHTHACANRKNVSLFTSASTMPVDRSNDAEQVGTIRLRVGDRARLNTGVLDNRPPFLRSRVKAAVAASGRGDTTLGTVTEG